MDKEVLTTALDNAMWKVADKVFKDLSAGMSAETLTQNVWEALNALGNLQKGNPPDYDDPWVALFYMTWYQPKQIQLVHFLMETLNQMTSLTSRYSRLRLIDFGCGTFATKFAVAWLIGDMLENRNAPTTVAVDCYDPSRRMIELGNLLWRQFCNEIRDYPQLKSLNDATKMVKSRTFTSLGHLLSSQDDGTDELQWLSAIHAVYEENSLEVSDNLLKIMTRSEPECGILSVHNDRYQSNLLEQVSPFGINTYEVNQLQPVSGIPHILHHITQWRHNVNLRLTQRHSYLGRNVTWSFANALGLVYTKKS